MNNLYSITLRIPVSKYKTFYVTAENENEAIVSAKAKFEASDGFEEVNDYDAPEVQCITCTNAETGDISATFNLERTVDSSKLEDIKKDVASACQNAAHKCKCEKDEFYALLKSNDVAQRVRSAVKGGEMAMINLEGVIENKNYKITIRLDEIK